jgi:Domain of unknown function (DUF4276)
VNREVIRLNLLVEGQTEEAFVRSVIAPHLNRRSVFVSYRRVETSRRRENISGRAIVFRGGVVRYAKLRNDILRWLKEDARAMLTTMIDVYGLPPDFPELEHARGKCDPNTKVAILEEAFKADVGEPRFIPYLQLHEYEALLFSDVNITDSALALFDGVSRANELRRISDDFASPEHIDEGPNSAPSKRLQSLFPAYDKVLFGPLIAESMGLGTIRHKCPHFDHWITRLESLAGSEPT